MSETVNEKLWVFGYGSLCWNPGFKYSDAHLGYVKGFKRRFWQGNNTHRGTEEKLGRVVTLIEDEQEVTWGKAFQVDDEKVSRNYLDKREVMLGGYTTILTTFEPLDKDVKPFNVLIYIALEGNDQYLGKASYDKMAMDIISSKGKAGHNLEYLANLAYFMRENLPHIQDDHLFLLEQICIYILKSINSTLLSYFYTHSIEEKWKHRIEFELKIQYSIQHVSERPASLDSSDGEESDPGESTSCFCTSDEELTNSDDLLFNSTIGFTSNQLFNDNALLINNLLNSSLLKSDRLYLNDESSDVENMKQIRQNKGQNSNRFSKYQADYPNYNHLSNHKRKKNLYPDFNHPIYNSFDYNSSNQRKWSIKGY